MRIFTRKSFEFSRGGEKVITSPLAFHDVPDWVKDDPYFKLVKADGDAEIIASTQEQKAIENEPKKPGRPPKNQ